nr:BRCT domain-containing protein At4g02110-like isoform X9 [Lolium perenne]
MSPHDGGGDDGRDGDGDGLLFAGVRFALAGFDPVTESQYRADMVERGGADAGGYGEAGCTHVIVFGLVYDDPVCVAARGAGKKVVTELWVDDTLDTGAMADADRVIYRPVRDLNGIPGSQSLNICLTGYQKDGREDIMKMVSLMGAQFSKPLKADTVTHLICYKFEGEKYELAKKVNINLVNHMWLEACLKAWEILPIDNYRKSGWEQEMMEAQVEDSADEADDAARVLSRSRGIARRSPITEIRMGAHVDPDVYAPIRDPTVSLGNAEVAAGRHLNTPKQVSKTEDVCERSLDARADIQSTHNTNFVTNSADTEARNSVHSRINPCSNEKAPGDHITRDEEKNGDKGPVDARASALPTINTNGATECADHFVHQPTVIPAIPVVDTDNIADGSDLFIANSVQLPTPSAESLLEKPLQSSDMTGKVDHKDNGPVANLVDGVGQSNSEGNIALVKANSISAGNSASKNSPILGYSRRRSRKSVSPGTNLSSAHQTASLHSYERNSPNVKISISPSTKSNHTISKLADAKSPRDEATQCVDRSDIVLAQTNSGLSSASPLPLNGGTDSAAGTANIPLPSREIASEAATVSDPAKKSTGSQPIKVNGDLSVDVTVNHTVSQMSGSSKKKVLSYRRASLKLAKSPEVVEKLPEIFAKEAIIESLAKAKELAQHELAAEKACAISPSLDSEFEKGSSSFSNQNWNIEMSNAPQVNSIEVAEVSHATMEAGAMKLSSSRVKSTGAKRSRNATNGAHTSFASRKREIATYKSRHNIGAVISHENIEADKEKDCTSPNAAECTTSFPEEILSSKARSVDTSSLNANSEMNGVPGASKLEFANLISQGNINKKHRKLPSSANDNNYQKGSSEKVSSAIEKSAVANVSQPADMRMVMVCAATADKADTVSLKSSFSEAVPQADTEKLSSSASADNHEPCAPDRVPNKRVRKAVAKRKISGALQYIPSEAEVLTIKQAAESSTNAGKAMGKDLQSANEDGMANQAASFCKDSFEDGSEDMQNIRPMTSKKNKVVDAMDDSVGQNKENIPVNVNLSPKSKYGNKCVGSKCMKKPVQKGKGVLCERSMTGGNDCGTLSLSEPTWFILGGHRLLRKDYMSILRRLKGRVCRSSHHWSFQATHLIAPELRRTEKFFAAAAAGRWILKADYLSACNEAGKFLEEESFEWHGDGLNSGDTISLDAPRKWRHLRERTGHGAFHGMKIIIYGECISPSLDTMKRALRAGDGTILATSPPYTRLLKHDVSFAVVSAGMASTDAWVQEFMNHNIPCVSADYLVEYVCKPGHPLSKHVLFNMHELAEKSLQKIQNSQRDELGASTGEAGEGGDTEPSCSACGSSNREGALMLICSGSQGNKASCGAGMHVDCLNLSPEAAAPDGDWLCPKCDDDGQVKPPPKKAEKGARKLKPKAQMSSCC